MRKSKCCNAETDFKGGGYEGEYIHPIVEYCTRCKQDLKVNGREVSFLASTEGNND